MTKSIMVNNDGHGVFYTGMYDSKESIERNLEVYRDTFVKVLEWCISLGSKSNYPSKVTELIGEDVKEFPRRGDRLLSEVLRRLISSGVDPLRVVIDKCHEINVKVFPSMRMNPDYNPGWMGEGFAKMYNSRFWWENPHLRIKDRNGRLQTKLSYAYPEVQKFKLEVLKEMLNYDIDGLNLDFLRHPPFLGYEDPLIEGFKKEYGRSPLDLPEDDRRWLRYKARVMTGFLWKLRWILDDVQEDRGKRLEISVRVDHRYYFKQGLDVSRWIREGLVDKVIVSEHGLGGFVFSLRPFVEMTKGGPCELYFGEEAVCSGHDLTPEEDRLLAQGKITESDLRRRKLSLKEYCERALRWYKEGADGVHIFNDPHNREAFKILGDLGKIREFLRRT